MQELSQHALYMRLKRLCDKTAAGKLQVAEEIHKQWKEGCREQLGLALVRALKQHGFDSTKKTRDAVRVCRCGQNFFFHIYYFFRLLFSCVIVHVPSLEG